MNVLPARLFLVISCFLILGISFEKLIKKKIVRKKKVYYFVNILHEFMIDKSQILLHEIILQDSHENSCEETSQKENSHTRVYD
jgi:hypothetical protein